MRRRNTSRDLDRPGPSRSASLVTAIGMLALLGILWFFRGSCGTGMAGFLDDMMRPSTAVPGVGTAAGSSGHAAGDGTIRIEGPPATATSGAPASAATAASGAPGTSAPPSK